MNNGKVSVLLLEIITCSAQLQSTFVIQTVYCSEQSNIIMYRFLVENCKVLLFIVNNCKVFLLHIDICCGHFQNTDCFHDKIFHFEDYISFIIYYWSYIIYFLWFKIEVCCSWHHMAYSMGHVCKGNYELKSKYII